MAQAAADGQAQEQEAEACHDHGGDVEGDREGVHLLFEDVGGEEGKQREAEEEAEVGVEDGSSASSVRWTRWWWLIQ